MTDDESAGTDGPSEDERDALLTISHGAVVTSGGVSIRRGLSTWLTAILTRGLGPELYGVYAFAWRLTSMVLGFANLGANMTLLRDIPGFVDEPERQQLSLGLAYVTTTVAASVLAVVLLLGADLINEWTIGHPEFPLTLRLFAILLVLLAFVRIHTAALKAAKSANGEVILNRIIHPVARLAAAATALALGYSLIGVVGAFVVIGFLLAVAAYPPTVMTSGVRPSFRGLRSEMGHFFDHAIPSALSAIGSILRTRIDVLLIGMLLTATAAGIYNVVLVLVGIAAIPLISFNQLMPPVASELYASGNAEALNAVYTTITRLIVTTTIPMIAILSLFGHELLGIFGSEYTRGYAVLLVFLVGRFIGNAVGAVGILLSMTNNQYSQMWLEWLLAISNLILTYLFVTQFGLIGAALGTSMAIAVQNALQLLLLFRFEGLWPFDATFLKPIMAGIGMAGVMVGVRMVVDGLLAVGVGTIAGLVAFVAVLGFLGVPARDELVICELATQYRRTFAGELRIFR